ncbi:MULTISPECIES: RICIN domain-containing protein [unclassified Chitinophaga]|uniref:RICIN domain-containing protein n=1 Tax=unclassified Chitinophaga TaxID=2619133 RepID=UPI0009F9D573|nr:MULTISPECIES: RICIN domain-containing protein [unclassified Chitinophaga]WPV67729.1 RICIN domain-containing protein [Chitinophaga sp. LS1]
MKRNPIILFICLLTILTSCSKKETALDKIPASSLTALATTTPTNTNSLRGINWADPNGNEAPSRVVTPSGLSATITAANAAAVGKRIADSLKQAGGTTIRMPITPLTASNVSYWPVYQAAINAIVTEGCNVILCYWPDGVHHVPDTTQWYTMWKQVDTVYKNNAAVLYEPINEPVDYSSTNLCNLYANFLNQLNPASWKCILDGTGYAGEVISVGNDSRLTSQYLGLHCYWWFYGSYNVWSSYYNIVSGKVGTYASRTVITEVGVETFRKISFWWQWDTGVYEDQAFLTGSLAYSKDNLIGTIAWSGVNDIDTYRWFSANNNLVEVNPGCANMFRWSWGLTATPKWQGPIADGRFKLQNRASNLMLDNLGSTTDGASVAQWQDGTSANQQWNVSYTDGYYTLSCATGKNCLDVGSNTSDGSAVQQKALSFSNNSQRWTFVSTGDGYYKVVNLTTGKCLDTGGQTTNGSSLQQWSGSSSYNQQWKFIQL